MSAVISVILRLAAPALAAFLLACRTAPGPPPAALELVGVLHDDSALAGAHDVEVQGDVAYVAGKGGTFAVVDISDPASPALLGSIVDKERIEDAETVAPLGDIVLLGARDLFAIDVSDPHDPRILAQISDRPRIDRINGMAIVQHTLFSANKSGWISAFDVSNPAAPKYLDAFDAASRGNQPQPHDIALWGRKLVVVSTQQGTPNQFRIYEPFSAEGDLLPADEWGVGPSVSSSSNGLDLDGANRVAVQGELAFVGAFAPDRMAVIDLNQPAQLANMPVCDIDATGLTIVGDVAFVSGGECVEAIDVSQPDNPRSIAQFRGGELFPTRQIRSAGGVWRYDNGHDLVYRDGLLYVTAQIDNRLGILKIHDQRILALARSH